MDNVCLCLCLCLSGDDDQIKLKCQSEPVVVFLRREFKGRFCLRFFSHSHDSSHKIRFDPLIGTDTMKWTSEAGDIFTCTSKS